jgi:ribosomal protein L7/L12
MGETRVKRIAFQKERTMDEAEMRQRLLMLERKVDFLFNELDLEAKFQEFQAAALSPRMDDVIALLRKGNKIGAIKLYQEKMGVGLREAKDAVERMEKHI